MLTVRPKVSELAFRVFGRSLHPELFEIFATRTIAREQYRLKVDITSSGHLLTWQRNGLILSEVTSSTHQPLPMGRLLYGNMVGAVATSEIQFRDTLDYTSSYQLDPADPKTFAMIQAELLKSAPCEGMVFQFQSSGRMALGAISYVNIQSRRDTVHVRAFHTFPDAYIVLKSESVFSVTGDALQQ